MNLNRLILTAAVVGLVLIAIVVLLVISVVRG